MYVYVCECVCMYVCMYVRKYVRMHVCICMYVYNLRFSCTVKDSN
jgi:hypothetical protein